MWVCVCVITPHNKVNAASTHAPPQDIRRIVRNDGRVLTKLHRRIFLDAITHDACRIYMSFYVDAANRWAGVRMLCACALRLYGRGPARKAAGAGLGESCNPQHAHTPPTTHTHTHAHARTHTHTHTQ